MREIKFNVWDPNTEKMYRSVGLDKISLYDYQGDNITEQEGLVILQWTGLTDRNGKEIYEGDVVKRIFTSANSMNDFVGKVQFDEGQYWIIGNEELYEVAALFTEGDENHVIGNIHENPKLIGGADNE